VAKLLVMIRGYCCQFDLLSNEYMAIVAAINNLFYFFQKNNQLNANYHEDFITMLEVIEEYGGAGSMTHFPNMLKKEIESMGMDLAKATSNQLKQAKKTVRDKFLVALMLSGANGSKWSEIQQPEEEHEGELRDWDEQISRKPQSSIEDPKCLPAPSGMEQKETRHRSRDRGRNHFCAGRRRGQFLEGKD
jgi:hypothetical protein